MAKSWEMISFSPKDARQRIRLTNLSSIIEVRLAFRAGTYEDHMPDAVAAIERATVGKWYWHCSHQIDWSGGADVDTEAPGVFSDWVELMLNRKWPTIFEGWFASEADAEAARRILQPFTVS